MLPMNGVIGCCPYAFMTLFVTKIESKFNYLSTVMYETFAKEKKTMRGTFWNWIVLMAILLLSEPKCFLVSIYA